MRNRLTTLENGKHFSGDVMQDFCNLLHMFQNKELTSQCMVMNKNDSFTEKIQSPVVVIMNGYGKSQDDS